MLDICGFSQPVTLTTARTESVSGEWMELTTGELRDLHVGIDPSGVLRLAEALLAVTGSPEHSHWDRWLE